jgi:predicted PurR-regulated permease PerM
MVEGIRRAGSVAWALCGIVAVLVVLGIIAWVIRVIWPPAILAGAIVFLLNPIVTALQGRGMPRVMGTALSYLGIAGLVVLAVLLIAPLARDQYDQLADEWPEIRDDIEESIDDLSERSREDDWPVEIPTYDELEDQFSNGGSSSDEDLDANSDGVISDAEREADREERQERFVDQLDTARELGLRVFHVGLIFLIGPIIAFYLLVDLPNVARICRSLVPRRSRGDVMVVARRLNRAIGGYFRGQLAVAAIVGTMVSIGLAIIDLPFWLIIGIIAGLFNMIPLIGPWVGAVPGIIIALTTRDVGTAVWVAVIMAGAQQIDNHFISPMVMQRAVRLHPAVVMLALLAGGTLGGFFGLLLAVPVVAVIKIIVGHVWRRFVLEEPLDEVEAIWDIGESVPADAVVLEPIGSDARDDAVTAELDIEERAEAARERAATAVPSADPGEPTPTSGPA